MPDTNVLVSAAIASGPPRRVIELARAGAINLVMPDLVIEELIQVLGRQGWSRERLRDYAMSLDALAAERLTVDAEAKPVTGDPDDDRILACAIAAAVDVIVSGNRRHLLPLGSIKGVRILAPRELIAELRSGGG